MQPFNTANLKKVISLSSIGKYTENVEVKPATYEGDTYDEGTVQLNIGDIRDWNGYVLECHELNGLTKLLQAVWPNSFYQLGLRRNKIVLFVYEQVAL